MKKVITSLFCIALIGFTQAQSLWKETKSNTEQVRKEVKVQRTYTLDLANLRNQLKNAQEVAEGAKSIIITLPSLNGKMERFEVYSAPVMEKAMADQYQLGSYIGRGVDDKFKTIRFSVSPYDFQSMSMRNGELEFIEPMDKNKTTYGVFEKTNKTSTGKAFECSTTESALSKEQISRLIDSGSNALNTYNFAQRASDQKHRTMRLALSVTAEYTNYFGGVPQALSAMNATMTRVNAVLEQDMSLNLIMVNNTQIIYTDPATDPYSPAAQLNNWNIELQTTLNNVVGDANYDIGHLFGASGGGGNAGCIGCVCESPTMSGGVAITESKGSGYTSPSNAIPSGDTFDIDYVAHELGHQLGANHTFSHNIEGSGVNVEPGSGSTIMGYAGITSADVQSHSDAYFHAASISQMQANLTSTTCDAETVTTNLPPVITPMVDKTIPKGTAFHLTATATDPNGDAITYNWEQMDSASSGLVVTNGQNIMGASFRSFNSETIGKRFFPKYANVLADYLSNDTTAMLDVTRKWEAVSNIQRVLNFRVTVRDNNLVHQSQFANQKVTVGADGPFKFNVNSLTSYYANISNTISWNVANTNVAPYNSPNVMLHYSTDNGLTWIQITASTPNNGSYNYTFASSLANTPIRLKVEAIGNVFYSISPSITIKPEATCDSAAPTTIQTSNVTNSQATVIWSSSPGATYTLRYRLVGAATWTTVTAITSNTYTITGLSDSTNYEFQIATTCLGTTGAWSSNQTFSTLGVIYCPVTTTNSTEEYISQVKVNTMTSDSGASDYTDYYTDNSRAIQLIPGSTANSISVSKGWQSLVFTESVNVWIDFDRNGVFDASEQILTSPGNTTTPVTGTFAVPASAPLNSPVKMRVMLKFGSTPPTNACTGYTYGEIEDYKVTFVSTISTTDIPADKSIQVYPNPVDEVINITKVSDRATYTITSAEGRLISKGYVKDNKVSVSGLAKGFYIISINNEEKSKNVVKFIKK